MALANKSLGFKTRFSDFFLWSGIIVVIVALIIAFLSAILQQKNIPSNIDNPLNLLAPNAPWNDLWNTISNFTIQTNILILFFFFCVLTNRFHENKSKFIYGRFSLAITVYISIAFFIFWGAQFKPILDSLNTADPFKMINFVNTFLLHLVVPLIMIFYYLLTTGQIYWGYKKMVILFGPIITIYLFAYLAYALLKGTFVGVYNADKNAIVYSFPYDFLNYKANLGRFFIYFSIILVLTISLIALFTFYNNLIFKKNNKANFELNDNNF